LLLAAAVETAVSNDEPGPPLKENGTTEVLLYDTFEQVFPRLPWRVAHPQGSASVDWGRSKHRASAGRYSIYCAGMGPAAPEDGGPAPANTASWAIVGPFDLSETTSGTLSFDLWLQTEPYRDVFMWLVSTDGQTYSGSAKSTDTNGWQTVTTDLANWGAAGDVIGEPEIWIAFVYQSDHNGLFEGAYVDEVELEVDLGTPAEEGRTYTSDDDFEEGTMVGLVTSSGSLVLSDDWDTLPYVWVPNSVTGTVSKIDAESGNELGRYRTGPNIETVPGAAAVDLDGSCWVANRNAGTVVKIGLYENGGCADRDGDGLITTSKDSSGNGDISGSEELDWGEDECVLVEVSLVEGSEGIHVPGEEHEDYEANDLQAVAVDDAGDVWAGVYDSNLLYRLDGSTGEILEDLDLADDATYPTAAVVDGDGTLWLSSWPDRWVLGVNPSTGETNRIDLDHGSYGMALDGSNGLFVTGLEHQAFTKIDTETDEVAWLQIAGRLANGVATTEEGRIWIAAAGDGTVTRYRSDGAQSGQQFFAGRPTGLAVDQDGRVWVSGSETESIYRLDPSTFAVELEKPLVGSGGHDATGDFTGIVVRNLTSRYGTWTVIHDSQVAGTPWGTLSWKVDRPMGTATRFRARSSEDQETWSEWERTANGAGLEATPPGRYIEIEVALQQVSGEELPKLNELTIAPIIVEPSPEASFTWTPEAPAAGQATGFQDTSTGEPTTWSWSFGDGSTSDQQNPTHTFASQGSYEVSLTATNDAGSDTATETIEVSAATGCSMTCTATVPATADLNADVPFAVVVEREGCSGATTYAWSFGDGATSDQQNPSHAYSTVGTLRWQLTAAGDGSSCSAAGDITISGAGPDQCDLTYWVPVVSRADGANGSVWRSDLGLLGVDPAGASVELRLHTTDPVVIRAVTVAPGAMVNLVDVVEWIGGGTGVSGSLEICADGELAVDSRTYNVLAEDQPCFAGGTFGQHLAGQTPESGLATGESARLGQLRESARFRTNIGMVNTGVDPATVEIALFDATGAELARYQVEVEPGRWRQENRPFFTKAGRDDLDAASAKVTLMAGDGVIVYASVIDNSTNDATTIPMHER
jgi:streptogramin lyase